MSDILYIDLETAETIDTDIIQDISDNIKPPGNIKKQETIDKWVEEKKPAAIAEAVSKTSFSGLAGSIVCICWAVNDGEVQTVYRDFNQPEGKMIQRFWEQLVSKNGVNFNPMYCGHNICGFDLRFLFHRCVINNIKPPIYLPYNDKPWSKFVYDTLFETMGDNKAGGSLGRIAKAFDIEGKLKRMDGSMVNQYFLDGREKEIALYCKQDVEITRNIYKKLNFL